ncbi:MAG: hypothetical protein JWN14_763 [Chthonomonadales bacterium]|nr:hypothetical protein [Chthonomonadales bacterium]
MRTQVIVVGSVLLLGIGIVALRAQNGPPIRPFTPVHPVVPVRAAAPPSASLITGYRSWERVNSKPHQVASKIALMCRAPTKAEIAADAVDPHLQVTDHASSFLRTRFVTVYVNKTAEQAMMHQKRPAFSEGSLIVKERLARATSSAPEMLTVMHKREKGYNPACGDWEFLTLDGAGKQTTAQGRLQNCESCHSEWKQTDYVSRAYLSDDITRKFR